MSFQIAFAVPGALDTQTGGSFYDRRLVECLRELGHGVDVLTLPDGFPFPSALSEAEALAQLQAVPAGVALIVDGLAFGALPTDGLAAVTADIVALVHHPLALETGLDSAQADRLWRQERANLRLARHVLVPSAHTKRVLAERYEVAENRITVLEPGIDRAGSIAPGTPVWPPLILSVGLLHPRKGHDLLIAALKQVTDLEWQAVIVGTPWDDDHHALLRREVADPALAGRVRLAGAVPNAERDALYGKASLFALATRYEGYGIVFNEALIHGLPILSCRTGAVPDTVPGSAGILVPPDDPAAFAQGLRQMLSDEAARQAMAAAAMRAGAALPTWADVAGRAAEVLRAVSEKGAAMIRPDDLARAIVASQEAGEILLGHYRGRDRLTVSSKRAGDFVSEADIAAEAHLRRRLQEEGDGWLGEETDPQSGGRRWIVDPLDGTTNFLRGIPHWCVSVGLEIAGRPALGVVHDPLRAETFAAAPGLGLRLNGEAAGTADSGDLASALFGTGIPFGGMAHIADHAADIARLMPHCAGVRRMGAAALDLAWVAAGRLDGFWERRLRPWDIAAGLALLEASGAVVEGIAKGEDPWQTGTVLTATPALFAPFAALIRAGG